MYGGAATMVGSGLVLLVGLAMRLPSRRGHPGLWDVLLELAKGRATAASERERRATAVEVLERLPDGGRMHEVDERGRRRTYEVALATKGPADVDGGR
ncbi:hypothetical protein [Streptomyces sp. NPDC088785]|uniref:hypothetical protein n=1 Tax=Streptomyces sp. NPDC088785 TaxID=3365897 RepID=UPI00381CC182